MDYMQAVDWDKETCDNDHVDFEGLAFLRTSLTKLINILIKKEETRYKVNQQNLEQGHFVSNLIPDAKESI
jgi:hypothetical protein